MALRRKPGRQDGEQPAETLARVRGRLQGYRDMGESVQVSVAHVLDLLDPDGMWRHVRQAQEPPRPEAPGGLDPMTGCRPVTG